MNKQEFLAALKKKLSGMPRAEREERLAFYSEMIDDKMEAGLSEAEAVASVGATEEIGFEAAEEKPTHRRKMRAWEIVLLILGSPLWISLLAAAFSIVLAIYAVIWSVVVTLWAVFASLAACGPAGLFAGLGFMFNGFGATGLFLIASGLACAGLAILAFFGCLVTTKGVAFLTKQIALGVKGFFGKKEGV